MKKNSSAENRGLSGFLVNASFLLRLSGKAYEKYMANKIYIHALNIRKANEMIYQLVIDNINHIPVNLQDDCIELLNHYDCWLQQFKYEERKRDPGLGDEFIFHRLDGQMAYPRSAEERIIAACSTLKKKKNK